jgi:hypothetical protein
MQRDHNIQQQKPSGHQGRSSIGKTVAINQKLGKTNRRDFINCRVQIMEDLESDHPISNAKSLAIRIHKLAKLTQWKCLSNKVSRQLTKDIEKNAKNMDPQGIANVVWGLATLGHQWSALGSGLQASLMDGICSQSSQMNPQNVAMVVWGLATLGHQWSALGTGLQTSLMHGICSQSSQMNPQGIANVVWGLATLGHQWSALGTGLQTSLMHGICSQSSQMNPLDIGMVVWGFVYLQVTKGTAKSFVDQCPAFVCDNENLLKQIDLFQSYYDMSLPVTVNSSLREHMKHNKPQSSQLHQDVSDNLNKLGYSHSNEIYLHGFYVDILYGKTAIEVQGPSHETAQGIKRDRVKSSLLQSKGYGIIEISYRDWRPKDNHEKQAYLKNLLGIPVNQSSSGFFSEKRKSDDPMPGSSESLHKLQRGMTSKH